MPRPQFVKRVPKVATRLLKPRFLSSLSDSKIGYDPPSITCEEPPLAELVRNFGEWAVFLSCGGTVFLRSEWACLNVWDGASSQG